MGIVLTAFSAPNRENSYANLRICPCGEERSPFTTVWDLYGGGIRQLQKTSRSLLSSQNLQNISWKCSGCIWRPCAPVLGLSFEEETSSSTGEYRDGHGDRNESGRAPRGHSRGLWRQRSNSPDSMSTSGELLLGLKMLNVQQEPSCTASALSAYELRKSMWKEERNAIEKKQNGDHRDQKLSSSFPELLPCSDVTYTCSKRNQADMDQSEGKRAQRP
ncbi:uncharacterized protein LOC101715876 [Heterocephalus glaber]|uniref:Uncharacterized protein LOC101715876 n=1 Tax=Heterocephalus glaber TaxID=10181 RepID=A0AAX6QS43_HETGA|nr:uncharacterized protein LOC101715876 [Heterocephalus glaber]